MTASFKKIIGQCDDIDLMDDATIFSISGTKSEALAQQVEIEGALELVNSSITYIEDDSTDLEEESVAYSIYTDLPLIKFNQLISPSKRYPKKLSMVNVKLNLCQELAIEIAEAITNDPLAHLTEQNANLGTFQGKKIISYHYKEKHIAILCEEEGDFTVGVSDDEGTEAATGFSEKLAIIFDIFYQEIASESDSLNSEISEGAYQ
jgi:hypothetical protein